MCKEILRAADDEEIRERRVDSAAAKIAALNLLRVFQGLTPRAGDPAGSQGSSKLGSLGNPLRDPRETRETSGKVVKGQRNR